MKLSELQDSENIVLDDAKMSTIGADVLQGYLADKTSRDRWEESMLEAEKLALQVEEPKSYPWANAANVKFPLITIAAMQFAARAYPALVKAPDLVKFRVQGKDEDGKKAARSARISSHMSYQLLEEDEPWEEHHDKALLALPILGCVFKKSYYDKTVGHNRSVLILPKNLVVHYYAKSIEECERKTEIFELSPRKIKERQLRGLYSDHDLPPAQFPEVKSEDKRQGISAPPPDKNSSLVFLEQHCYLDLDEDGYKEPYIVTIEKSSGKVYRIVSRWEKITTEQSIKIDELQKRIKAFAEGIQQPQNPQAPTQEEMQKINAAEQTITRMQQEVEMLTQQKPKVLKIDPVEYYTKIPFIPSPDGGFYDLGFGALLGPLNDSVNTLLNQLIDAGTKRNAGGGFLGNGARIKGGTVASRMGEWIRVNVSGKTLAESMVPFPDVEPSQTLFQLMGLLITYSERVGSVTDTMSGENPGQNTPAYNMSAMLEQGMQVFNGVFKRVYRSMRSEFRKLYVLNSIYLDDEAYFSYHDSDTKVLRTDYQSDAKDLIPAADPSAFSSKEKSQKAQMISERAQMVPGYDPTVVEKRWLSAMDVPDSDELYPMVEEQGEQGPTGNMVLKFPPQPDPELELQKNELQLKAQQAKTDHEVKVGQLEINGMLAEAKMMEMVAKAEASNDANLLGKLELQLKDLISKRQALTAISVAEIGKKNETGTSERLD